MPTGQAHGGNSSSEVPSSQMCLGLCQADRTNYDNPPNLEIRQTSYPEHFQSRTNCSS